MPASGEMARLWPALRRGLQHELRATQHQARRRCDAEEAIRGLFSVQRRGVVFFDDMDVALRVSQWVTMMHDGSVVAEGTPAEIRANETVHELYLGTRYYDE